MRRIAIAPADRFRGLVVMPDVATNLAREVCDGREHAAGEHVALDFRKPELDLVEPRRVRRREMEMHVRMVQQEHADGLGLMRGEVVRDHMNLPIFGLARGQIAQKSDEPGTGMFISGFPQNLAGLRV